MAKIEAEIKEMRKEPRCELVWLYKAALAGARGVWHQPESGELRAGDPGASKGLSALEKGVEDLMKRLNKAKKR